MDPDVLGRLVSGLVRSISLDAQEIGRHAVQLRASEHAPGRAPLRRTGRQGWSRPCRTSAGCGRKHHDKPAVTTEAMLSTSQSPRLPTR